MIGDQTRLVFVAIYTLTIVLSLVGNAVVIVVFSVSVRLRNAFGCYIINLAVADLLMAAFCMPFTFSKTLLSEWVFSRAMCTLVLYLQLVSVTASIGTIMAIGIDRYRAVVNPLRSKTNWSRTRRIIALIWMTSCAASSVQLVVGRTVDKQVSVHNLGDTI